MRILQEVLFILDDVEDVVCTVHDAESVSINSFFSDYLLVVDACRMILSHQLYSSRLSDLSHWCLLFPMEYIFEDFVAGFLDTYFSSSWKVEYQKSNMWLTESPRAFQMQHDIFLTSKSNPSRTVIVDTKYKIRPKSFSDEKKGVSQNDLYQMLSYAVRRGCNEVLVIYPNVCEDLKPFDRFVIRSGFEGREEIHILAYEIPFWSLEDFSTLDERMFARLEEILIA